MTVDKRDDIKKNNKIIQDDAGKSLGVVIDAIKSIDQTININVKEFDLQELQKRINFAHNLNMQIIEAIEFENPIIEKNQILVELHDTIIESYEVDRIVNKIQDIKLT